MSECVEAVTGTSGGRGDSGEDAVDSVRTAGQDVSEQHDEATPDADTAAGTVDGVEDVEGDEGGAEPASIELRAATAEDMRSVGRWLAAVFRPGDLVLLSGELGAGKTTLVQGIGAGLGVSRQVSSPTFVIARVHPAPPDGAALVHVDAYRLGSVVEIDDLDLDTPAEAAVTVVEWGEGLAEDLAEDRLEVHISRAGVEPATNEDAWAGDEQAAGGERLVRITGIGHRWSNAPLYR